MGWRLLRQPRLVLPPSTSPAMPPPSKSAVHKLRAFEAGENAIEKPLGPGIPTSKGAPP